MASAARDAEFDVGGRRHRHRDLSATQQFALLRVLEPAFPALSVLDAVRAAVGGPSALAAALAPLWTLPDATLAAAIDGCLGASEALDGGPPTNPAEIMMLILAVFSHNFGPLLSMARPENAEPTPSRDRGYGPDGAAAMPNGTDWLYAPTTSEPPLCTLRELQDGTYHIEDVALMNDLLRVKAENSVRWRDANKE